jgi:hypothetical protein
MLLVNRETRLDNTQNQNSFFCRRCPYIVCAQNRLELTTWSANRSLFGVAQMVDFDKKPSIKIVAIYLGDLKSTGFRVLCWYSQQRPDPGSPKIL